MAGSQSSSEDDVIIRTTQIVSGMLYPDNCGVVLLNELGGTLKSHPSYWGINTLYELPLSLGITGQVATTGQPIRINDVTQHPAYIETTPGVRAELCVPIRVNEKIIGVFNVESRKMDAFDEEDERPFSFSLARKCFINEAACQSHGYTRDELMRISYRNLTVSESGPVMRPEIEEVEKKVKKALQD